MPNGRTGADLATRPGARRIDTFPIHPAPRTGFGRSDSDEPIERRRLVDILCSDGLEPRAVRLSDQHRQHLVDMLAECARPMMPWPR
jgi:hypothetical protein